MCRYTNSTLAKVGSGPVRCAMRHLQQSKHGSGANANARAETVTHYRVGHVTRAVTEGM